MATPTPTTVLRDVRLDFFTDNADTDTDSGDLACGLVASTQNVLALQGAGGTAAVRLTGLADATAAADAVSVGYLSWKAPVRAARTSPLSGTIDYTDGVITGPTGTSGDPMQLAGPLVLGDASLVVGDRVLISGQSTGLQNGIYYVSVTGVDSETPYELTRAHDFVSDSSVAGAAVVVRAGGGDGDKIYIVTNDGAAVVGTDSLSFSAVGGSSGPGGPVTIDPNSINLGHMEHGTGSGQLLYYGPIADPDTPSTSFPPTRLNLGDAGLPLVSNGTVPGYAALDGTGLAAEIYKESLIIGNVLNATTVGESIRFGDSTADDAAVEIYVHNTLRLSATEVGGSFVGTWSGSSDEKWKDLLGPISADPLADLDKVESQTWTWKPGYHFGDAGAFGAGVVAQQFQLVCPSAVTFSTQQDGLVVDYNAVHSFNLACVKALKAENASRQAENAALEARVVSLEQDNTDLKARLAALEAAFHAHTHP